MPVEAGGERGGRKPAPLKPQSLTPEQLLGLLGINYYETKELPNGWHLRCNPESISLNSEWEGHQVRRPRGLVWPGNRPSSRFGATTKPGRIATRAVAIALIAETQPEWAERTACG